MLSKSSNIATVNRVLLGVWVVAAPVAWWQAGLTGLVIVSLVAAAFHITARSAELFLAISGKRGASPVVQMSAGIGSRIVLVAALLTLAFGPLAEPTADSLPSGRLTPQQLVAFSSIPFYFALLAVEIFAQRPNLKRVDTRRSAS